MRSRPPYAQTDARPLPIMLRRMVGWQEMPVGTQRSNVACLHRVHHWLRCRMRAATLFHLTDTTNHETPHETVARTMPRYEALESLVSFGVVGE